MVKFNSIILLCIGLLVCAFLCFYALSTNSSQEYDLKKPVTFFSTLDAPYGKLIIATNFSDVPHNITLYRVNPQKFDMIDYWNGNSVDIGNVTSETEARVIAQKILENYGGLPEGSGPLESHTEYGEIYDSKTLQLIERKAESVVINCQRSLDGKPVIGGYIRMELGKSGELLNLKKVWRTVTPAGTIQVISPSEALQKILRGEVLNTPLKCTCDLTIDRIQLAYQENGYNESQEYLTPIWVFHGTLSSGGSFSYRVSATDSIDKSHLISFVHTPPETQVKPNNSPITSGKGNFS